MVFEKYYLNSQKRNFQHVLKIINKGHLFSHSWQTFRYAISTRLTNVGVCGGVRLRPGLYLKTSNIPKSSVMCCVIWYHLYYLKNVKNTHGGILLLVRLQASVFWIVQMVPYRATLNIYNSLAKIMIILIT